MNPASASPQSSEIASLSERLGYLQALRVTFAVLVLAAGTFASGVVGASVSDLVVAAGAYLLLSAVAEGLRRATTGRGLRVVGLMLLVDGAFLAWVVYSTGGIQSPLRFLFYVHLIAVTLLASYRTGLKMAAWYSLLYFVVYYAQAAGYLEAKEGVADALPGSGPLFTQAAVFNILALWVVAAVTTVFSAMNERELRRRKADLESLTKLAHDLENITQPDAIAQAVLRDVCDHFEFKRGAVLGGRENHMELLAFRGPGEAPEAGRQVDPIVERAWSTHQPQLVKRLDPDRDKRLGTLLPFARNVVVVPLFAEGSPLGALALEHVGDDRIERRVVDMVGQFAAHAALALRNAWLLEQVQTMAETDALTGVANRRTFEETLSRELSRAARTGEPLSLAMFDVDHFKQFNDTYGHQEGDAILRAVAAALHEASRDFDLVARYGGEEFAVVLPGLSAGDSIPVVDRLRRSLAPIDAPAPITASAGVATFPNHAIDAATLVKHADEALYESKREGRDRVTKSRRRATIKPATRTAARG